MARRQLAQPAAVLCGAHVSLQLPAPGLDASAPAQAGHAELSKAHASEAKN